ncbi:MAG: DUF2382 domain-containing protein [Nostocaceae cyanobacterium]|nr:DUF2382 domain-containing protein [Nostocaceae cyanobacterium]
MTLQNLKNFDPNYRDTFGGDDIIGMSVYAENTEEKIGTVSDVLVDDDGRFRYLIVDLGFWIFGKKVLLPIGRSRIDYNKDCIYARSLTKEQAENLPEYTERNSTDFDYEERVRNVYRSSPYTSPVEASAPLESSAALDSTTTQPSPYAPYVSGAASSFERNTYNYQQEPSLYEMNEQDHQTFRLYEERLVANKNRVVKSGEVAVGKQVVTETAQVAVPVDKEQVIIERTTPSDAGRTVSPGEHAFQEGEVARMEIYEERPDVRKETVLSEEVQIRKEVQQDTAEVQETLRREELDIDTNGNPIVDRRD